MKIILIRGGGGWCTYIPVTSLTVNYLILTSILDMLSKRWERVSMINLFSIGKSERQLGSHGTFLLQLIYQRSVVLIERDSFGSINKRNVRALHIAFEKSICSCPGYLIKLLQLLSEYDFFNENLHDLVSRCVELTIHNVSHSMSNQCRLCVSYTINFVILC